MEGGSFGGVREEVEDGVSLWCWRFGGGGLVGEEGERFSGVRRFRDMLGFVDRLEWVRCVKLGAGGYLCRGVVGVVCDREGSTQIKRLCVFAPESRVKMRLK